MHIMPLHVFSNLIGDLLNDQKIFQWMLDELKQDEIKEVTVKMLDKLVEKGKTMAVLFYDPDDSEDHVIMDQLEKIDDECSRFNIDFVKLSDPKEASKYGTYCFVDLSNRAKFLLHKGVLHKPG